MWKRWLTKIMSIFGSKEQPQTHRNSAIPKDDYSYNEIKAQKKRELDSILDKISQKGMKSLTAKEKQFLDQESGNI